MGGMLSASNHLHQRFVSYPVAAATAEDPPGFASYPAWPGAGGGDGGLNRAASLVRIRGTQKQVFVG